MNQTEDYSRIFPLQFGSYEDAVKFLDAPDRLSFSDLDVTWPLIQEYCALLEDGNPSYWDEPFARKQWGGIVAPPGLMMTWPMPLLWRPDGGKEHYVLSINIPLPGDTLINVATDSEFFGPVFVGDRINVSERLVSITPEKKTRLGAGHFLRTEATFRNQRGEPVAVRNNDLFRYQSGGSAAGD